MGAREVLGSDRHQADDATHEHDSMCFCDEEGTQSRFQGVGDVIEGQGLFCSLYTDRGSHNWTTAEAGGKADKVKLTQFGRAMGQLGIEMIPACSPEARGRSERVFSTHQDPPGQGVGSGGHHGVGRGQHDSDRDLPAAYNAEFTQPRPSGAGQV